MNIEIRRARYTKKSEQLSENAKNLRWNRDWWRITKEECEKGLQKNRRDREKLDAANPDLAAEALEVRRSHGFPG